MIVIKYYASDAIAIPYLFVNMLILLLLSIYKNQLEVQELKKRFMTTLAHKKCYKLAYGQGKQILSSIAHF